MKTENIQSNEYSLKTFLRFYLTKPEKPIIGETYFNHNDYYVYLFNGKEWVAITSEISNIKPEIIDSKQQYRNSLNNFIPTL